jgi:uncharacterized protein YecE (DUF72 family)
MTQQLSLFPTTEPGEIDSAGVGLVLPAPVTALLAQTAAALPSGIFLGTSSWSFPTWRGLIYAESYDQTTLARDGLEAYGRHPLLRSVGIDRTFYASIPAAEFAHYGRQVPPGFRFLVKAPAQCVSPWLRAEGGNRMADNAHYLDPGFCTERFVLPAIEGLGEKAGPLVFQFPPLGRAIVSHPAAFAQRLCAFLARLPHGPLYAVELRDAALLTDDYLAALRDTGVRHCLGLHPRQPSVREQARLLDKLAPGPLIVRWNLHPDYAYEEAREHYHPFTRLVDEDLPTRVALARLCLETVAGGHAAFVIASNKAEGSAPLTVFKLAGLIAEELPQQLRARRMDGQER